MLYRPNPYLQISCTDWEGNVLFWTEHHAWVNRYSGWLFSAEYVGYGHRGYVIGQRYTGKALWSGSIAIQDDGVRSNMFMCHFDKFKRIRKAV